MPEFVAHDVGTLARKDRPSSGRTMEELQALAVIEGIEVDTEIEINGQYGAHLPRWCREQCPPEVGAASGHAAAAPPSSVMNARRLARNSIQKLFGIKGQHP
jgi:hypothetical protein